MPIRFSVIIPVYNREPYVVETVRSALAQQLPPHQVIVVDDGSTDGSLAVLEQFGDAIELHRQSNQGCAAARNLGLKHSSGEYLAFLDSDDVWFPWTLRLLSQAIEEHARPPVLAASRVVFQGDSLPQIEHPKELEVKVLDDVLSAGHVVATSVLVIRRDVLEQVDGFVPMKMNGTDAELNLRIGTCGPLITVLQPPMLAYRKHSANVMENLENTLLGQQYMAEQERFGKYPGGPVRQRDRIAFITLQTRALTRRAVARGKLHLAFSLFTDTFLWNLRLCRVRYLLAMPAMIFFRCCTRLADLPMFGRSDKKAHGQ
jgi:hypothetical protein